MLVFLLMGSSPRMRGTRHGRGVDAALPGIIPAYAGNTEWNRSAQWSNWDHPRVCGEHGDYADYAIRNKGSSPRMRGTPRGDLHRCLDRGIIPAYAGNTWPARTGCCDTRDHPRVCGEHWWDAPFDGSRLGSSPRMRGTRQASRSPWSQTGIIPAHAGNTDRTRSMCFEYRDHPRVCGEHPTFQSISCIG